MKIYLISFYPLFKVIKRLSYLNNDAITFKMKHYMRMLNKKILSQHLLDCKKNKSLTRLFRLGSKTS